MEQRTEMVRAIGREARDSYSNSFPNIQNWFVNYDALYLLSYCSMYFLSRPEGVDPEAYGPLDFYSHYLEILQAIALTKDRSSSIHSIHEKAEELQAEMQSIGDAISTGLFFEIPDDVATPNMHKQHHLLATMRGQTTAVRNWAYYHQMKQTIEELGALNAAEFFQCYGLDIDKFISVWFQIPTLAEDKLNLYREKVRSFLKETSIESVVTACQTSFYGLDVISKEEIDEAIQLVGGQVESFKVLLLNYCDLKLAHIFTVSLTELSTLYGDDSKREELKKLFDKVSLKFGELSGKNQDYFIFNNPVLDRPFIKASDDEYYSSVLGIFPHISLTVLENLLCHDELSRQRYAQKKSRYLQDKSENLFKEHFPNAKIYANLEYPGGENDLLVLIDSFALVCELKSGKLSPEAKRGSPDRFKDAVRDLIQEPSLQASRFISFIRSSQSVFELKTTSGVTHTINTSDIQFYLPIAITFEQLGQIATDPRALIETGNVELKLGELALPVCYFDLVSIFHLLPLESLKIHYLVRRRELASHMTFGADELDFLAFYLENGFNIGDPEYAGNYIVYIGTKSKELDPYFVGTSEGIEVKKPEPSLRAWWRDTLAYMAETRRVGWISTSFALLNVERKAQKELEHKYKQLANRIKKNKVRDPHNWVTGEFGPIQRRYAISIFPYMIDKRSERNQWINHITSTALHDEIRGAVCIGIDLNAPNYPYNVVGRTEFSTVMDSLETAPALAPPGSPILKPFSK